MLCLGLAPAATALVFERGTYRIVHQLIAFLWPLGLVIASYWIYATAQAPPQPALTDRFAGPLALGGMLLPIAGFSAIVSDRLPASPLQILLLWTAVTAWCLLPELTRFIKDTPLEPYLGAIFLTIAGTVLLVAALIAPDDAVFIAVVGAVFCFFASGLVMFQEHFFDRQK